MQIVEQIAEVEAQLDSARACLGDALGSDRDDAEDEAAFLEETIQELKLEFAQLLTIKTLRDPVIPAMLCGRPKSNPYLV
jgi:hypothetical protein